MENHSPIENSIEEISDHMIRTQSENGSETTIDVKPLECGHDLRRPRQMHKILPHLWRKKHQMEPVVVSIGPYHHESFKSSQAEKLKPLCVHWLTFGSKETENMLYHKIMANIGAIRSSYAETSVLEQYNNKALALMMLRDASFIINYMANETRMKRNNISEWNRHLGSAACSFILRDIMKLENQVPLLLIKLLISLQQGEEWEQLLHQFMIWSLSRDGSHEQVRIPREREDPPLHLLEAVWRAITENEDERMINEQKISESSRDKILYYCSPRTAVDLKAKGIYFTPSRSYSLKAVRFESFSFSGALHLPIQYVTDQQQVMLSNLIAYELSPDTNSDNTVLSYMILMKSLIESPADVKELQKSGILVSKYPNHEQVVKYFEDIDTFGLYHLDIFSDVKEKIGQDCGNIAKTWAADVLTFATSSRPMTFIAGILHFCLTTLQTAFTIHHPN